MVFAFNCPVNRYQPIRGTVFAQKRLVCSGPVNRSVFLSCIILEGIVFCHISDSVLGNMLVSRSRQYH